jgi:hypothetical protein
MTAADVLRSLPTEARPIAAAAGAVTTTVTAALVAIQPGLIVPYWGACVAVYGPAAAIALYRTRKAGSAAEDPFSDPYDDIDAELCESCESRPVSRTVIVDGDPFAVCDDCSAPRPATEPPNLEVVR